MSNDRDETADDGFRSVGVEVHCHADVAEEITRRLTEATAEILEDYSGDEVFDWGAG
ncbi:hypothetical protein AB0O82_32575 [Kitasatospora sp. NPDC088264]|uniref:hypothetical protein n=1 Tax=Kitasatospora sp. NPDC088264 TaxID=3155296 RepID=UPI00344057AA